MQADSLLLKRIENVMNQIKEISLEDLLKKMNESTLFFLIDVRESSEWQKGSLPKAIHISRGTLELKIEKLCQDPNADIVVFCGGGTRSAFAAESLGAMGYQNVKSLRGGFGGWVESDLPIEIPR